MCFLSYLRFPMPGKSRFTGRGRSFKLLSIFFLIVISLGILSVLLLSIPERVEVKAVFDTVSLYPAGDSYRICLVYLVRNPKPYRVQVYVTLDLRDANIGVSISYSDVRGVVDNATKSYIPYTVSENYIIKFSVELSANEVRAFFILL
ncbi:MAG: hypothetical protein NDF58_01110 [archaeon YNP-LCB-024-027]|nr:hypothetical protein [Candidatus Culexarchaeum yellowstonense]